MTTHDKCCKVDFEHHGTLMVENELLEERGLYESIGLNTLGLLYSHFDAVTANKTSSHL